VREGRPKDTGGDDVGAMEIVGETVGNGVGIVVVVEIGPLLPRRIQDDV